MVTKRPAKIGFLASVQTTKGNEFESRAAIDLIPAGGLNKTHLGLKTGDGYNSPWKNLGNTASRFQLVTFNTGNMLSDPILWDARTSIDNISSIPARYQVITNKANVSVLHSSQQKDWKLQFHFVRILKTRAFILKRTIMETQLMLS